MASFNNNTQFHLLLVHLYFLVFLLISITKFPVVSYCCHEEDRSALLSFKSSLNDSSNRLSSWKPGSQHENCCSWHGIKCSNHSFRVVSIDLRNKDLKSYIEEYEDSYTSITPDSPNTLLTGKFSASIFKLTHLEYLDLAYNDFQESVIPRQVSDLTALTHLDLSYSNFLSTISTQFANLSSLQYLDLSCKEYFDYGYLTHELSCLQISSTKWMRGLINLQVLKVSGIELNSFPVELANLTSLSILELSRSNLHGSIPYLPKLKEIDVCGNFDLHVDLTRMFKHEWPKLETLWISYTVVNSSIPSSISNAVPLLGSLSAQDCLIQGSLPYSFYRLYQLQYLDLTYNSITGFIHPSISNLKSLYSLNLGSNNLQGSIPRSICNNLPLQRLFLGTNNITGTIPSRISKLQNLRHLIVDSNSIEGSVSLFSFGENLITLDMSFNKQLNLDMRFNLDPYSMYPKLSLKYLWFASCNLTGLFPVSFCNLSNLVVLNLSKNNLTGTIPSCLFKLKNLVKIFVSENKLHGLVPLPHQRIEAFDLSSNKFSGEISIELGKRLFNTIIIGLADNEFSGSIPFTLCPKKPGFTSTEVIDLSNNKLSGTIPSNIGYCGNLDTLKLGNNNLTGIVPDELKLAKHMRFLQLNNNHLDGTPLNLISEFHQLEFLHLANNNFEGSITNTLASLQHLRFLSLRSNKFNGSIPEEVVHLQSLQLLDLSLNNLSGHVPNELGNLSGLIVTSYLDKDMGYGDVQLDVATKGIMIKIRELNDYNSAIDLSSNNLVGNIPKEIGLLTLLSSLNLSYNHFSGDIPESVANLSGLESLDLSSNKLSGYIPQSLAWIDSLAVLNLSSNKLSGRIPSPHFDTLSSDGIAFSGNELLCGYPTEKLCEGDRNSSTNDEKSTNEFDEIDGEDANEKLLLHAIVALGLTVGFLGFVLCFTSKQTKMVVSILEIC